MLQDGGQVRHEHAAADGDAREPRRGRRAAAQLQHAQPARAAGAAGELFAAPLGEQQLRGPDRT